MLREALDHELTTFFGFVDLVIIFVGIVLIVYLTSIGKMDTGQLSTGIVSLSYVFYKSVDLALKQQPKPHRPRGRNVKRKQV